MGYRSEVAYVIGFDTKERREEFVALIRVRGDELWTALQECGIEENRPRINFYTSDAKWYDSYPDVKMHDRLLEFISQNYDLDDGVGWKFIRVGEEQGDVDERDGGDSDVISDLHDDFYPTQGMEIPFIAGYKSIGDVLTDVNKEEQHA